MSQQAPSELKTLWCFICVTSLSILKHFSYKTLLLKKHSPATNPLSHLFTRFIDAGLIRLDLLNSFCESFNFYLPLSFQEMVSRALVHEGNNKVTARKNATEGPSPNQLLLVSDVLYWSCHYSFHGLFGRNILFCR